MVRKSALMTAILAALSTQAHALGLGEIKINSSLNQPLDAEIQLYGVQSTEVEELRVRLASPEAYKRAGLDRPRSHTKMQFQVGRGTGGKPVIQVTSRDPVREPFLDFLIEANWSSGQVLREYTVLVDPPVFMPAPAPVTRATMTQTPAVAAPADPLRGVPVPAPVTRSAQVRSGVVPGEYQTQRNDTLWKIAQEVRPDSGVSIEQTMLGLLEANPRAFYDGNINNLKAGYVLRVPTREELMATSTAEALAEVKHQNQSWREGRMAEVTEVKAAAADAGPEKAGTAGTLAVASEANAPVASESMPEGQLKLSAPEAGEMEQAVGSGTGSEVAEAESDAMDAYLVTMQQDLNVALEAVESQRQENTELNNRLGQLEEQIASMQRLLELKDQELAQLQVTKSPAPATEQSVTDESAVNSATDNVLGNPLIQLGIGILAAFLAIFAWMGARRRRLASAEFQESILGETDDKTTAAAAEVPETDTTEAAGGRAEAAQASDKNAAGTRDSSLFTDFSVSDMGYLQDDLEADPLAETDVYLAYGRYQQAEELVKAAIEKAPHRSELKLKLLEVYYAAKNTTEFDGQAEALLAHLENPDDPIWQRASEMGRELNPDNPLYSQEPSAAAGLEDLAESSKEAFPESDEVNDFDMNLDTTAAALPEAGWDSNETAVAEKQPKTGADIGFADAELEYDLTVADATPESEEDEDSGEGVLSSADEAATKLDLARAYIEMGDPDGARSILQEVVEEGDDGQKLEAEGLMSQIA